MKKKRNLYNTKKASNKQSQSWQWVRWSLHTRQLVLTKGKWLPLWSFHGNNRNACSLHLLFGFVIILWLFTFVCSCKIAFCLGASAQYPHFTARKWTHPERLKKITQPKWGFRKNVTDELIKTTSGYNGIALTKWQKKQIWSLLNTGFIDLRSNSKVTLNFEKKEDFPAHASVYFVRGVFSNLRYSS